MKNLTKEEIKMNSIITKLSGVSFDDCQENINLYGPPAITTYELKREPNNPFDPNAIRVGLDPYKFGYVPKSCVKEIAPKMDVGRKFMAESVSLNQSSLHDIVGMTVKITEINN
jgi:hypothetical protein